MALTSLTDDLNIIAALDDEPNDVGGLSAAELKAKFDAASNTIKAYINDTLIAELTADGVESITRSADLATIKYVRLGAGNILQVSPDNTTWTTVEAKGHTIYDGDGNALPQRSNLKFINTEVADDGTYTLVSGIKGDKGDTGDTGAQGVQGEPGPQGEPGADGVYVGTGEMPEGYNFQIDPTGDALTVVNDLTTGGTTNALSAEQGKVLNTSISNIQDELDARQLKATSTTVTLTVAGWANNAQTVSATGVTAINIVLVAPAPASQTAYVAAGVKCTTQGAETLSFSCDTTPTDALTVNVVILP